MKPSTLKVKHAIFFAGVLLIATGLITRRPSAPRQVKTLGTAPDLVFNLTNGARLRYSDLVEKRAVVLAFLGVTCPLSNKYIPRLREIARELAPKGVELIALNSENRETLGAVVEHAREFGLPFRVAKDWDGQIARALGVTRTAEVVVLDSQKRIRYRGRIDDQFDFEGEKKAPEHEYLRSALKSILGGDEVAESETAPVGCTFSAGPPALGRKLTYNNEIAPLFQRYCISCHRPGGIAPMHFTTYEKIRDWAPMIEETVSDRRMPPWHADSRYGDFENDRSLPEQAIRDLTAWIGSGMPRGTGKEQALRKPAGEQSWHFGKPDLVVTGRRFEIPAQGLSYFENFYYKLNLPADVWVKAVEIRAGNPLVVHHATLYIIPPGQVALDWDNWGYFAALVPGYDPVQYPKGFAKKIPAGSTLYLEMHYNPRGKPEVDQTSVALYFGHEKRYREVHTFGLGSREFTIPAGASDYVIETRHKLDTEAELLGMYPHAHYRGKGFLMSAKYPDGKEEILLSVPSYDLNWQNYYKLRHPKHLPAGTEIVCHARYDNSARNPRNPNASVAVSWGPRTEDEMCYCFTDLVLPEVKFR